MKSDPFLADVIWTAKVAVIIGVLIGFLAIGLGFGGAASWLVRSLIVAGVELLGIGLWLFNLVYRNEARMMRVDGNIHIREDAIQFGYGNAPRIRGEIAPIEAEPGEIRWRCLKCLTFISTYIGDPKELDQPLCMICGKRMEEYSRGGGDA